MLHLILPEGSIYGRPTTVALGIIKKVEEGFGNRSSQYRRVVGSADWTSFDQIKVSGEELRYGYDSLAISEEFGEEEIRRVVAECKQRNVLAFVIDEADLSRSDGAYVIALSATGRTSIAK